MKFLVDFVWQCKTIVVPLIVILWAVSILFLLGHRNTATMVSNLGTFLVVLLNLVYVVFFHSRERWINSNWQTRTIKIFTFQR